MNQLAQLQREYLDLLMLVMQTDLPYDPPNYDDIKDDPRALKAEIKHVKFMLRTPHSD